MKHTEFGLIETMLWENGGYFLPDLHMERLGKSANHFGFSLDKHEITLSLENPVRSFDPSKKYRVRLVLERTGKPDLSSHILPPVSPVPVKITFSGQNTDKNDVFLRHKTTNRKLYDTEFKKCRDAGFFDVIFTNTDGEVTEGAITNIMIRKDGTCYTPPLSCGILPGTYREYLLQKKDPPITEKILHKEDLLNADEIFVVNSVRKTLPAVLG